MSRVKKILFFRASIWKIITIEPVRFFFTFLNRCLIPPLNSLLLAVKRLELLDKFTQKNPLQNGQLGILVKSLILSGRKILTCLASGSGGGLLSVQFPSLSLSSHGYILKVGFFISFFLTFFLLAHQVFTWPGGGTMCLIKKLIIPFASCITQPWIPLKIIAKNQTIIWPQFAK